MGSKAHSAVASAAVGQVGYGVLEMMVSMGIMVAVTGAIFQMVSTGHSAFRTQPEIADLHQRLRIAADMIYKDLLSAGAGQYIGANPGPISDFLPAIRPGRYGALESDGELAFASDRITIVHVPRTRAQTVLAADMGGLTEDLRIDTTLAGCPPGGPCGFASGMRGLMHYIELDVGNLARWLSGAIGASCASALQQPGPTGLNDNGYLAYFSDRRTNNDSLSLETGEYGYEDFVNTGVSGIPNGINEDGEDVNSNGTLDIYGMTPMAGAGGAPLDPTATVYGTVLNAVARTNPPIFFRRALKLVNGGLGNLPVDGLTVTSENPVYVQGYYNANASGFGDPHASAAIIADAVTLLSIAWNDWNSLDLPHDPPDALPTYYRFAVAAGTSRSYARPGGTPTDFGTDGGVQNLMRLLEDWTGDTLYYRGSLAPLWFSRQARGSYKCCTNNVFVPPTTLVFEHDADFLSMTKQPPGTPYISDINITGFRQILGAQ